jgi:GTP cyclohydrolase FolE2
MQIKIYIINKSHDCYQINRNKIINIRSNKSSKLQIILKRIGENLWKIRVYKF